MMDRNGDLADTSPASIQSGIAAPVLVIGRTGMLGKAWLNLLTRLAIKHRAIDLPEFDFTSRDSVESAVDGSCPTVVNCAAYTDVDKAETAESIARTINATGPGHLADRCAQVKALLIHYSTDYVFDGLADRPYTTDHPRNPVGAYGRTKAEGELRLEQSGCAHLLIRTSWLYAPWGTNFVRTISRLARERDSLRVVGDQRGRPTSAEHLADASVRLLSTGQRGVFHITDGGECSWFEFAGEIVRLLSLDCRVEPCNSDEYPRPARRPMYSVLDISATEKVIGPMTNWKTNLASVLERLEP